MGTKGIIDENGYGHSMLSLQMGAATGMDVVEGLNLAVRSLMDTRQGGRIDAAAFFHAERLIAVLFSLADTIGDEDHAKGLVRELIKLRPVDRSCKTVLPVRNGPRTLCHSEWLLEEQEAA